MNEQGIRCNNRYQLEMDHAVIPFSRGGEHSLENLILSCSNHNSYRAHRTGIGYETTRQFTY